MPFDLNNVRDSLLSKRPTPPIGPQVVQGISTIFPVIMLREPVARVVSFANFLNIAQELFEKHPERLSCNQQTSMVCNFHIIIHIFYVSVHLICSIVELSVLLFSLLLLHLTHDPIYPIYPNI
jgi:hypothetical protein